jgi:monofunctional glycosyltransferase
MINTAANVIKILFIGAIVFVTMVFSLAILVMKQFPSDREIRGCVTTTMNKVYLCPKSPEYVRLNQISDFLKKSVVLSEDSAFWSHQGFDLGEIEKSMKANVSTGKYIRGGSTISQQLAKNMFLSKEKTLLRKIKEAIITIALNRI